MLAGVKEALKAKGAEPVALAAYERQTANCWFGSRRLDTVDARV